MNVNSVTARNIATMETTVSGKGSNYKQIGWLWRATYSVDGWAFSTTKIDYPGVEYKPVYERLGTN